MVRALALVLVGSLGCARPPVSRAIEAYADALAKQDFARAYRSMSASYRERVSEAEFVTSMKAAPDDAAYTAKGLRQRDALSISAEVEFGLGDSLRLVDEDGQWRIATDPLKFYDQSTPRAALRSFTRAYQLGRWDVMLRFVPAEYRRTMTAKDIEAQFTSPDTKTTMGRVVEALDGAMETNDIAARIRYGERYEVRLLLEDGAWMIQDLE